MMKGSVIGIQEKKAKWFNEWERFTSTEGESIESYYHHFLKLMNDLKRNKHLLEKIVSNLKFLNNLQPEWSRHVTIVHQTKDLHTADYTQLYDFLKYNQKEVDDLKAERLARTQDPLALMATSKNPHTFPVLHQDQPSFNQNYMQQTIPNPEAITDPITAMNMELALIAKAFNLNYTKPTNNNQRISSNIWNLNGYNDVQNVRNQVIQHAVQNPRILNVGNQNGLIGVSGNANQNLNGNGNVVAARAEGNATRHNGNQIRCYNCRGVAYLDEIKEVNANCILMANLQQASTSGTQTDKAPVYDSDGSAKVKSTIVTLQRVVKQRMTLETHNWSSSAHQELHKIVKDEIFSIVNQVDARVQNFEIQFLKEAAKFVRDFKYLEKEADESLVQQKALELEIECLLRVVVSQDIMIAPFKPSREEKHVPNNVRASVRTKSITISQPPVITKKDVNSDSNGFSSTGLIAPFKPSREEKHVPNNVRASVRTKSITISQPPVITKKDVNSDSNGFSSTGVDNIKTRRPQQQYKE
nr:hypothetical protein [Tanacetum cinerariifolium]